MFCSTFADFLSWWFIDFHSLNYNSKLNSVLKFHGLDILRKCRCHGNVFRSLPQLSLTLVLHVVDLFVFCGILASFLDCVSFSIIVLLPRPEFSLSVNKSVKRSSVRKLKLSTACSLSAPPNEDSKLFSESSFEVSPLKLL